MASAALESIEGILLERIWPPCDAPDGWLTQIGGAPNLPPDLEWPRAEVSDGVTVSLDFLAQISLADLPRVLDRDLLPKDGMLYFFAWGLAAEALQETQWRVLYTPSDGREFPSAAPPLDAGYGLDDLDYGKTPAAEMHDPDDPPSMLFPRCPVRPTMATFWKKPHDPEASEEWRHITDQWQGSKGTPTDFKYAPEDLPRRVEDALLHLNYVRNAWAEGVLPFKQFVGSHYSYQLSRKQDGPRIIAAMSVAYDEWLAMVKTETRSLKRLGRSTLLDREVRARVRTLISRSLEIERMATTAYPHDAPERFAITSLATLLLDRRALDDICADEIAAAHPERLSSDFESHRMLGVSRPVQGDIEDGTVLLLQLESDWFGPRFQWWDMGNITFTIGREDLKAMNFHAARAEIAGH